MSGCRHSGRSQGPRLLAAVVAALTTTAAAWPSAEERAEVSAGDRAPIVFVAQGPETSSRPTRFTGGQFNRRWYHYVESAQSQSDEPYVTPIETMEQNLHSDGYKCISYKDLALAPGYRVDTGFRQFGDKTYVLQCTGDCADVFYTVGVRASAIVMHFGSRYYFPVVQASTGLGYITAVWSIENRASNPAHEVKLRVYQWTNDLGDYGGGCKLFE
jgi:hypothetical protein